MSANSFGHLFKWTSFGESHGPAIGALIEGCPAGLTVDRELLNQRLQRRRPGQISKNGEVLVSSRNENDEAEILSGVFDGKTLGTPIAVVIRNQDARSGDYEKIKSNPRIGHADDVWQTKFGHVDYRGGGRASARETAARVIAGSFAEMICRSLLPESNILAFVERIGPLSLSTEEVQTCNAEAVESSALRFPSNRLQQQAIALINDAKEIGESYGGTIVVRLMNFPAGLGQPVYRKIRSDLAMAMMSINACVGVESGEGFSASALKGTELHQQMKNPLYGGIRGGISTGEEIKYRLAFKPTSSIGETAKQGRHDPCILPRAVPVVEAMAWAVMADHLLWSRLDKLNS